ncbi:hypothetical protein CHR63_27215 [Serratia marcescens]|nr:hypothetical protein CHR63_27215 [Serratia marcescens]
MCLKGDYDVGESLNLTNQFKAGMSVRELVKDARCKIEAWRIHYNRSRPYSALGWMTPSEFTEKSVVTRIYSQIRFLLIKVLSICPNPSCGRVDIVTL